MKGTKNNVGYELLTPRQVAKILMVSPITVRQWAQKGRLKAYMTAGGHRRFSSKDVEEFAQKNNVTKPSSNQLKILIIDDNVEYLKLLVHMFESFQLNKEVIIETATDGFDGGLKIHTFKPDFLLLDLKMHGMDGFEVCEKVKNNTKTAHIRILTMTGFTKQNKTDRILQLGAEVCLAKPIKMDVLLDHLDLSIIKEFS